MEISFWRMLETLLGTIFNDICLIATVSKVCEDIHISKQEVDSSLESANFLTHHGVQLMNTGTWDHKQCYNVFDKCRTVKQGRKKAQKSAGDKHMILMDERNGKGFIRWA